MVLLQPILGKVQRLRGRVFLKFCLLLSLSLGLSLSFQSQAAWATALNSTSSASLAVAGTSAFHFEGDRPLSLGLQDDGRLLTCPETPNCVSSEDSDSEHQIAPIRYDVPTRKAMQALKQVIDDSERAEVLKADEGYIYAEFTSRLLGFVDDVEFAFDSQQQEIHVRSASRLGQSDLGVNRKRIETIRTELAALLESAA